MTVKLLTEPEVAEILRVSTTTVKRLRAAGKLAYLPGWRVLIDSADLDAYIQNSKRGGPAKDTEPDRAKAAKAADDAARAWAFEKVLLRPVRRKLKPKSS